MMKVSSLNFALPPGSVQNRSPFFWCINNLPSWVFNKAETLKLIYLLYANDKMINPQTFLLGVVTPTNNWNLQISDFNTAIQFGYNNFETQAKRDAFQILLDQKEYHYWNDLYKSLEDAKELALIEILAGSGITLSKRSSNNSWTKESISSNNIVSTPCN